MHNFFNQSGTWFGRSAIACLLLANLFIAGCGNSGGGGGTTVAAAGSKLGGILSKGPVTGALVDIYTSTATGNLNTWVVTSNTPTDAYGNWTATIPAGIAGPFIVVSRSGGTFTDEYSNLTVNAPPMKTVWDGVAATAPITPLTTAVVDAAYSYATQNNTNIQAAFTVVKTNLTAQLGFDPVTTPADNYAYVAALTSVSANSGTTTAGINAHIAKMATGLPTNQDITPPVITLPANITLEATGVLTPYANIGVATAVDNTPGTLTPANNAPVSFPVGVTKVIWTAVDAYANAATAIQTVTVVDTTAPTVTAPVDIYVEATALLTPYANIGTATAIDLVDAAPAITNNMPASFPLGTTQVTWSATDAHNIVGTAIQNVIVVDTIAPVVTAQSVITVEASGATTAISAVDAYASATDAVSTAIVPTAAPAGPYAVGIHNLTWSATDGAGNTGTAPQVLTITDTTPPTITLNGTNPLSVLVGSPFADPGATATDLVDGNLTASIITGGVAAVSTAIPGTFTITYDVSDAYANAATQVTRTVNVVFETVPPVVTAPANILVEANAPLTLVNLGTATAVDDPGTGVVGPLAAVPTASNVGPFPVGTTTVTWSVQDLAGNTGTATQTVTVTDTTAPTLTFIGPATINIPLNGVYKEAGATASDLVFGDVSGSIVIACTVNTAALGIYTLTYNVSDGYTNAATQITRTVNVNPPAVMATLMTNGNSLHYLDAMQNMYAPLIDTNFVHASLTMDPATNKVIESRFFNDAYSGTFIPAPLDPYMNVQLTLGAQGWQQIDTYNSIFVDNGAGSLVETRPDGVTVSMSASELNVAAQNIAQTLPTHIPTPGAASWAANINPAATFSAGASVTTISRTLNADLYALDFWNNGNCTVFGTGANCAIASYRDHIQGCANLPGNTAPTLLSDLLTMNGSQLPCAVQGVPNNKDLFVLQTITGDKLLVNLMANNIADNYGTVNFYTGNNISSDGGSVEFFGGTQTGVAMTPTSTGVWNLKNIGGSPAYVFDIPAGIQLQPRNQGMTQAFYTVHIPAPVITNRKAQA